MNKKTVSQTDLFFSGLLSRMLENKSYFTDITIEFKSGTKLFPAVIILNSDTIELEYQAVRQEFNSTDEVKAFILAEASKYDEMKIIYSERGARIVITADEKGVKLKHEDVSAPEPEHSAQSQISGRQYVVNPALASDLLREIGILAKNGKVKNDKIRKYNQIDHFVELIGGMIDELGEKEEICVLDCACGKSYLSFVLNFYFREILKKKCHFIGVDYSDVVIDASKRTAKNLGYNNMEFVRADLRTYLPSRKIDLVISLHACDTATDMALALGIRSRARAIVCVPCCHKDILKQYSYEPLHAVTKHGILKARLADTLTDALRASYLEASGYKVSLTEYISPLETPKNIMIRALYTGKKQTSSKEEYEQLKNMLNVNPAIERFMMRNGEA